jgi:pimeloyl-ACP methyl ester carboxylesterase
MILPLSAVLWAGHALYRAHGFRARMLPAAGRLLGACRGVVAVEVIERCGHVPQLERPEVVGPRIARFAAGLRRPLAETA